MNSVITNRLLFPEYLCIDEVYLNIDANDKYVLVLLNYVAHDVVDIVISRKEIGTRDYFLSISKPERDNVKYLICDMYN